jgi:hypothetical protein
LLDAKMSAIGFSNNCLRFVFVEFFMTY